MGNLMNMEIMGVVVMLIDYSFILKLLCFDWYGIVYVVLGFLFECSNNIFDFV